MDPWDVNLLTVADAYLQKVRELQALDLRVPANVILACALLLRFKAESLRLEETPVEEEYFEQRELLNEEIPELVYKTNQARQRKLTLHELIAAVEEVMKDGPRQQLKLPPLKALTLDLPRIDMSELMHKTYAKALEMRDPENLVLFSTLVQELKKSHGAGDHAAIEAAQPGDGSLQAQGEQEKVELKLKKIQFNSHGEALAFYLVPILHLVQQNKVLAWQEEFFSEILLKVEDHNGVAQTNNAHGANANSNGSLENNGTPTSGPWHEGAKAVEETPATPAIPATIAAKAIEN